MQSQINKWGNSAAIRIPANILSSMGLSINSNINIQVIDGKMIIEPIKTARTRLNLPFSEETLLQDLNTYTAHADELASPFDSELGD